MHDRSQIPIPPFFDRNAATSWGYRPDHTALFGQAHAWALDQGIKPAATDEYRTHLLLIDLQKDFCHPEGSLYVGGRSGTGAIDDNRRIAEFIYRNLDVVTSITTTMDTHFAYQIFCPSFWIDDQGAPLEPFRTVTSDEIRAGKAVPNPVVAKWLCSGNLGWLRKQVEHYCSELERAGKYQLYLWPPHCLLGSEGHALAGVVHEAHVFHSFARGMQSWVEVKGGNPLTENYSVLRPEVLTRHDGRPLAQRNAGFLKTLLAADRVIIAGQAASHCVRSSIDDLVDEIAAADPALAKKVYILTDCMSAVTVPDGNGGFTADFTAEAEAAFDRFAAAGMNLIRSTDELARRP